MCQGDVRSASIEGIELKCPVLVENRSLRQDSGGAGKYRGGLGLDVRVRNFVEGRWNLDQPRRQACPPWGLWGGNAGRTADYLLRKAGDKEFHAHYAYRYLVPADSEVIVRTGGGGGWGDPLERAPEKVRWDVLEELVSLEAAREHFGVVLKKDLSVDEPATTALRRQMARVRS